MNYKLFSLQLMSIAVSYLMLNLSIVSATAINIIYNGDVKETFDYDISSLVNTRIFVSAKPTDIGWSDPRVNVSISSGSLSNAISKIYIYKCKTLDPAACSRLKPEEYSRSADVQFRWKDISQKTGNERYPEVANLMILIKLNGPYDTESWIGLMERIERTELRVFVISEDSIDSVNLYAKSEEYVEPILSYIRNFAMIPFNWLERVVFTNADRLYSVAGSASELDSSPPKTTDATINSDTADSLSKDYHLIFPETPNGVSSPLTLNLNPYYECGNSQCELGLGETKANCCYDCGCDSGFYCDASGDPSTALCRSDRDISLDVVPTTSSVSDCSSQSNLNIEMRVNNAPASMEETAEASLSIDGELYTSTCTKKFSNSFDCPFSITPPASCGKGTKTLEARDVKLTITYSDGPNKITKDLSKDSASINWNYDCSCGENEYCDSGEEICKSEDAIQLSIKSETLTNFYRDGYNPGDTIDFTAKIFNAPSDATFVSASANLTLPGGRVNIQTVECSNAAEDFEYDCSIYFDIVGYDPVQSYQMQLESLRFTITYSDGASTRTKTLVSSETYPIGIPSQYCGNGNVDTGEDSSTCCLDAGCSDIGEGYYCNTDKNACEPESGISVSVEKISENGTDYSPSQTVELVDCSVPHDLNVTLKVSNPPGEMEFDSLSYMLGGVGYTGTCVSGSGGRFSCTLTVPDTVCEDLAGETLQDNSLELAIKFPDGNYATKTLSLNASLPDIHITPTYHCGDGVAETNLGESSSNCCIDIPCDEGFYCDYDKDEKPNGECIAIDNITLMIDEPEGQVTFESCEVTHKLNVKARILNKPSQMRVEQVYGQINGSQATIRCSLEDDKETYNCTMRVPKVPKCSVSGSPYFYGNDPYTEKDDNSVTFVISYKSGKSNKLFTRKMTAVLPPIQINQNYESLYDIIDNSVKELKSSLDETLRIAEDIMDQYESCMDTYEKLVYVAILANIASAFVGIGKTFGISWLGKEWTAEQAGNFMKGVGSVTTSILESWAKYCELLSKVQTLKLKTQDIRMEQIKMKLCIKMNQHLMDSGMCTGKEESCFNSMTSCVNFNKVDGWMSELSKTTSEISDTASKMGKSFIQAGEGFSNIADGWTGGGETLTVILRDKTGGIRSSFCEFYKKSSYSCYDNDITVRIAGKGCKYPAWYYEYNGKKGDIKTGATGRITQEKIDELEGGWTPITLKVFCYEKEEDFLKDYSDEKLDPSRMKKSHTFYVYNTMFRDSREATNALRDKNEDKSGYDNYCGCDVKEAPTDTSTGDTSNNKKSYGSQCKVDNECESGTCVDGYCALLTCSTNTDNKKCKIDNQLGVCKKGYCVKEIGEV